MKDSGKSEKSNDGQDGVISAETAQGRRVRLPPRLVIWVGIEGPRLLRLRTKGGDSYWYHKTMKHLEELWDKHGHMRITRDLMVNLSEVREVRRRADGWAVCIGSVLAGGEYPVSQAKVRELKERLAPRNVPWLERGEWGIPSGGSDGIQY